MPSIRLFVRHAVRVSFFSFALVVLTSNILIRRAAVGRVYNDVDAVPRHVAALVLGTSGYRPSGGANPYFEKRMDAAAHLYHAAKVDYLVVSGDNSHRSYNEPQMMYQALRRRDVPHNRIILDYAGFRTLDSIVRMAEVFEQRHFTVVSQRFHVERALFLARANGYNVVAYAAADVTGSAGWPVRIRELGARIVAVADVYLFRTRPRFLGDPVLLPVQ